MQTVLVLGAGIKGSAVAALAALRGFSVTLIERDAVGSGTTSTNHGRLHLGTAAWWKESPALIQRRRRASELMRRLPMVTAGHDEAFYCFEEPADWQRFQAVAAANAIPVATSQARAVDHPWIEGRRYAAIASVPEFSFDPARMAGRFAQTCVNYGGSVLTEVSAVRCESRADRLVVRLSDGREIPADIVVNTMTRWCASLEVPDGAPRFDVEWWRWRLLCLRAARLEPREQLRRVIVVMDRGKRVPSAVPHGQWITLDCKDTAVTRTPSPESLPSDWRLCDVSDGADLADVVTVAQAFPPLRDLERLIEDRQVYSLAGVHARLRDAPAGSTGRVLANSRQPGYLVTFGGQASTAFLDAIEIVGAMNALREEPSGDEAALVAAMAGALSPEPIQGYRPMRWNQQD